MLLVGIDLQPIDEVRSSLETFGDRYLRAVFTAQEVASCGVGHPRSPERLAVRFAAKEAVMKVLAPRGVAPPWRDVEVQRSDAGLPSIALHGAAAAMASERGIADVAISLSHAGGVAAAAAVASTTNDTGGG